MTNIFQHEILMCYHNSSEHLGQILTLKQTLTLEFSSTGGGLVELKGQSRSGDKSSPARHSLIVLPSAFLFSLLGPPRSNMTGTPPLEVLDLNASAYIFLPQMASGEL